jgi:hypothetical protein
MYAIHKSLYYNRMDRGVGDEPRDGDGVDVGASLFQGDVNWVTYLCPISRFDPYVEEGKEEHEEH